MLDFSRAAAAPSNRWNVHGEPTVYLGSDPPLVLAELARHLERDAWMGATAEVVARRVYRLTLHLDAVFDLCDAAAWHALSLADAPAAFLDRQRARAVAAQVRYNTTAQALRVPSVAFLDDLARWSLVVFLEKAPSSFVKAVADVGRFEVREA